jgi:carboxyl-terminal processing protease
MVIGWTAVIFFGSIWISNSLQADEQDQYFQLKKSWVHMQRVYEQLNLHYVDDINPYPLVKAGIEGMLEKLDPYTQFIDEEGERRLRIITTGKYGGLGMEISLRKKNVTIISPMDDSPAKRAGIRAGDIIKEIDGEDVSGMSINDVSKRLRGKIGTEVRLLLARPGIEAPIEMVLKREEIVLKDVGYTDFVEPGVGYISLNGFTEKASSEVRRAIHNLKDEGTLNALILDLRGNPGGLLESAVEIVNLFVDKGEMVVYTKGYNEREVKFLTEKNPVLPDIPLAVLVNEGSASASEIVAGALQDLDRAIILGEETFGKGLVQKVYTIDKNSDSRIKITTAKYYIPSGRCIQKRDYATDSDAINGREQPSASDLNAKFFTRNKREVYDKGGIYPDIQAKGDSIHYITMELIHQNLFFDFAVQYHQKQPTWEGEIEVTSQMFSEFQTFLNEHEFDYDIPGKRELDKFESIAEKNVYNPEMTALLENIRHNLELEKKHQFNRNTEEIKRYIKLELAEKYHGKNGRNRNALETDKQVQEAIRIVQNNTEYKTVLSVND